MINLKKYVYIYILFKGQTGDIGPIGDEGWQGDDAVGGDLGDM